MKSKYRKPPHRLCDNCGQGFNGWTILCSPCAKNIGVTEDERESLRDLRKRLPRIR